MRHYCTYFDQNYLTRGLALHASLQAHAGTFSLTILCMDEPVEATLRAKHLPHVHLLPLQELVGRHPALAAARENRTPLEFYFTCTSWLMLDLLPHVPAGELLTYLDSDLYFFSSPEPVFTTISAASVAITPHRFPTSLVHLERYGKYNVGWVSLRHDATGLACATDWAGKCADWCFNTLEPTRYADQKYLDAWTRDFAGTVDLAEPGVNAAPWNIKDVEVVAGPTGPHVNQQALIFYHFHALKHLGRQLYDPSLHKYDAELSPALRDLVYLPYLRHLLTFDSPTPDSPELIPPAQADDPRSGLAVPHLLAQLRASELDRAQRLSAIELNQAATQQTIVYLRAVEKDRDDARAALDQTVAFLKTVEQDSAERLASIHFYQDKLKTAYSDHERNMVYLKMLEAEIAAHIKVSADKDAIIAQLAEQLRVATTPPTAG